MKLSFTAAVLLGFGVSGFGEDATQLDQLRTSYESAIARATRPVTEAYLKELQKLRDNYTRAARLPEATKVDTEIKSIVERNPALGDPLSGTMGRKVTVLDQKVVIPANSMVGFRLGPLKQGDTITLQYLEGKWKGHGTFASDVPDETTTDESQLAIAKGPTNGRPGEVIKLVPGGTAKKPLHVHRADLARRGSAADQQEQRQHEEPGASDVPRGVGALV